MSLVANQGVETDGRMTLTTAKELAQGWHGLMWGAPRQRVEALLSHLRMEPLREDDADWLVGRGTGQVWVGGEETLSELNFYRDRLVGVTLRTTFRIESRGERIREALTQVFGAPHEEGRTPDKASETGGRFEGGVRAVWHSGPIVATYQEATIVRKQNRSALLLVGLMNREMARKLAAE